MREHDCPYTRFNRSWTAKAYGRNVMASNNARAVGRRRLLKGTGALAAAGVIGMPAIVKGQGGAIKIGVPTILSGRVAVLGQTSVGGLRVVFDKVNEAGGINGRKIEVGGGGSKGGPQEGAKGTRGLIKNDGCQNLP